MEIKEVQVACPCCQSQLTVDVRTSKVVRWNEAAQEDDMGKKQPHDFDDVSKRVQGRMGSALDKFDENLARDKRRGKDLDELFRKANEKLTDEDEE